MPVRLSCVFGRAMAQFDEAMAQWQPQQVICSGLASGRGDVACGFHAGDLAGILRTLLAAQERGVAVGAHVSYPDLIGFGRRDMDVACADLLADVIYQIGGLQGLATAAGTTVRYVKPRGALYNAIARDRVKHAM